MNIYKYPDEINKLGFGTRRTLTNLVDDLMYGEWYSGADSKSSGYAITKSNQYGSVQSLVLNNTDENKAYSIEEYEKLFNDYCENLQNLMNGIKTPSEEDLAKIEQLKEEIAQVRKQLQIKILKLKKKRKTYKL
ncbi:MAG: hypothetical protein ACLTA5_03700 [Anaerococcus obesiensis]